MMNELINSKFNQENKPLRGIRSFSRRQGRLTKNQKIAVENYWVDMGINFQQEPLNLSLLFGRHAPLVLEIGFGMGSSLVNMAQNNPHQNFLGIEVYTPGVGACLSMAKKAGIKNLRIICHDAVEVFQKMIPNNTLSVVQLFFPDPWYKKRHNKRRIVQMVFCELVMQKLILGGVFHIATDWEDYAKHILKVINKIDGYVNLSESQDYILRPETRPLTKFEQRGRKLGYGIWDLMFKRISL